MSQQSDTITKMQGAELLDTLDRADTLQVFDDSLHTNASTGIDSSPRDTVETVLLKNKPLPEHPREASASEWVFGVLIVAFLLFASVKLVFNKYLASLFHAVVNLQTSARMYREKNYKFLHGAHRLNVIFYLVGALYALQYFQFSTGNTFSNGSFLIYLYALGALLGYFILKFSLLLGLGILVNRKNDMHEYIFNIAIYNKILGLGLGVVTACVAFFPLEIKHIWLTIGIIMVTIVYLLALIRGGVIFLKRHFSILYMILYLCTLEILPILLIYKIFLG